MKILKRVRIFCILFLVCSAACRDDLERFGPTGTKNLKNECLLRTYWPKIAGEDIEFVYGFAMPYENRNRILAAWVEASIAGAEGTYMEHRSAHPSASGGDEWVIVGDPSVTTGTKTEVLFTRDTCAAALRYYWRIPEDAKGQEVSFTFNVKGSNNETVSYKMGPYAISMIDMARGLALNETNCYISIEDMAVYDIAEASANASKVDLIYLFRNIPYPETSTQSFGHAFVSPVTDADFRKDAQIPTGANNSTLVRKTYGLRDRHLDFLEPRYDFFATDIDLKSINFSDMPNYALNMYGGESGMWVETQDGRYRAYIFLNSAIVTGTAVISMKRLKMY